MGGADQSRVSEDGKEGHAGSFQGCRQDRAVEDVYRDEKGGIWYDKDEEMEYVHWRIRLSLCLLLCLGKEP